jgi:hypothetical protein
MKASKSTDDQIIAVLYEQEAARCAPPRAPRAASYTICRGTTESQSHPKSPSSQF